MTLGAAPSPVSRMPKTHAETEVFVRTGDASLSRTPTRGAPREGRIEVGTAAVAACHLGQYRRFGPPWERVELAEQFLLKSVFEKTGRPQPPRPGREDFLLPVRASLRDNEKRAVAGEPLGGGPLEGAVSEPAPRRPKAAEHTPG